MTAIRNASVNVLSNMECSFSVSLPDLSRRPRRKRFFHRRMADVTRHYAAAGQAIFSISYYKVEIPVLLPCVIFPPTNMFVQR
ncbi:hypothetical protein QF001_006133 [Paraburkholderia youngii]